VPRRHVAQRGGERVQVGADLLLDLAEGQAARGRA
jgi:hypothetical protein